MGFTRFAGPVYGAKGLLWTYGPFTPTGTSTGGSTLLASPQALRVVPPYEDWCITEVQINCSTNSSGAAAHAVYLKSEGGSTTGVARSNGQPSTVAQTIATLTNPAGSTTWTAMATVTATPGEAEGAWVPAGSTLRIVSSGVSIIAGLQLNVMGYIRYVDSTRSVGA